MAKRRAVDRRPRTSARRAPSLWILTFLVLGGAVPSVVAYELLTSRGSAPGEFRLWEVSENGQLNEVGLQTCPSVGEFFQVDPFGRFVVHPRSWSWSEDTAIDLYEIDGTSLHLRDTHERPGWAFWPSLHALTPDGAYFLVSSRSSSPEPDEWYLESLRINPDLTLEAADGRLQIEPGGPENVWPLGSACTAGSAVVSNGYIFLATGSSGGAKRLSVLDVSASGEFLGLAQQMSYDVVQPITGGWAVRGDQRVAVTGPMGGDRLTSFAISSGGLLSALDTYDVDEFGGLSVTGLRYQSSRLVTNGTTSVPVTSSGEFSRCQFWEGAGPVFARSAISPDGRIAVCISRIDAEGFHWGVFRLDHDGSGVLIREHVLQIAYTDIAFIPPRTEEMLGDANGDCVRNAADVVTYINHFNDDPDVGGPLDPTITGPVPLARADADQDGDIDTDDMAWLIDFLVGSPAP